MSGTYKSDFAPQPYHCVACFTRRIPRWYETDAAGNDACDGCLGSGEAHQCCGCRLIVAADEADDWHDVDTVGWLCSTCAPITLAQHAAERAAEVARG